MRQKELRLALVCYGGVSLAVYMHGITKEVWHLARASRAYHENKADSLDGVAKVYRELFDEIEAKHSIKLRVLPDILTGASAGGINAVFLAHALHSGVSLEPLTDLWLKNADVSELTDDEAKPMWRYAKIWAQPIADWFLKRPGNVVSETVSPETREEVRTKVSKLVRGRWFSPPFSGDRFSAMLFEAFESMASSKVETPLLPPRHPVDLFVTATDFRGHTELLRLNSPAVVAETEHRMPIAFQKRVPKEAGHALADPLELVLAARATASFPGAFPPLRLAEIDRLAGDNGQEWASREAFFNRVMPGHSREGTLDEVALIDGAVLVNAPFGAALAALDGRPSQREVDRRFVYIDPRPDRSPTGDADSSEPVGFFGAIFGSLSTIPREQPIRDDLERIEQKSRDAARLTGIVKGLRPEIDRAVEKLFGMTFFLNHPTSKRLANWRAKAHQAAYERAGYAFGAYAQIKFTGIVEHLAGIAFRAAPELELPDPDRIADAIRWELHQSGLDHLVEEGGGAGEEAIAFFRAHDTRFRIRRLQLLARRLARDWEVDPDIPDDALDIARAHIYEALRLYQAAEAKVLASEEVKKAATSVLANPALFMNSLAGELALQKVDMAAEAILTEALEAMPRNLKRRMLLTYLGFPFYDVATLPLLQSDRLVEFDPVKVDRISPDDALSIRDGGTAATLRGIEFYNFGAFFSRAYRENDYIWGRLHGAERMIDLVCSTVDSGVDAATVRSAKRDAFLAILEEETHAGRCRKPLIERLEKEVLARFSSV
ncbi:MAG: patatin-like protein [Pseudomonadota bacterium]